MRDPSTRALPTRPFLSVIAAVLGLGVAACGEPAGPSPEDVDLRTDRTAYTLQHAQGLYWIELSVTYTNHSAQAVYLHRACGSGDGPHRELRRVDDSGADIELGAVICITRPLQPPIEVGPGDTYLDRFSAYSAESPNANPPITMDQRTGTFRLEYFVQSENRVEGWEAVALLPEARRVSNSFRVEAP